MTQATSGVKLPAPGPVYDPEAEAERNRILEQADEQNLKRYRDAEPYRLILRSPDGTRWNVEVDNAGNLTTTAL